MKRYKATCAIPGCTQAAWKLKPFSQSHCYRHSHPSRDTLATVYQSSVETPRASIRDLETATGIGYSTVNRALWTLHDAGAIVREPHKCRATVIAPAVLHNGTPYAAVWLDIGD